METKILELLLRKLAEQQDSVADSLRSGAAKDYADYQHLCGVVRGLGLAQIEIDDLLRSIRESTHDD